MTNAWFEDYLFQASESCPAIVIYDWVVAQVFAGQVHASRGLCLPRHFHPICKYHPPKVVHVHSAAERLKTCPETRLLKTKGLKPLASTLGPIKPSSHHVVR